jgi:hypothetical protein
VRPENWFELIVAGITLLVALGFWWTGAAGGSRIVLLGITLVVSSLATVAEGPIKLALWCAFAALLVAQVAKMDASARRFLRPLWWMSGAMAVTVFGWDFIGISNPRILDGVLLALIVGTIGWMAARGIALLLTAQNRAADPRH